MNYNPYQFPQAYNPIASYQQQMAQMQGQMNFQPTQMSGTNLIRVTGIDGAKAYTMPPNSVVPLFDDQNDILYVKSTDGAGFPTIRTFAFSPIENIKPEQTEYVSRSEFEEFKNTLVNTSKTRSTEV
jgi:hypothetical protein